MSEADKPKKCDCCNGRGYHRCECWPGDCICGFGDETCEECAGDGIIWADDDYGHYEPPEMPPAPSPTGGDR